MSGKLTPSILYCDIIVLSNNSFLYLLEFGMFVIILVKPEPTLMVNLIRVSKLRLRWNCRQICWNQMSLVESRNYSHCDVLGKNTK